MTIHATHREPGRSIAARVIQLDSLRGVAAMTVVWHHWDKAFHGEHAWFLYPLMAGHEAVILFFVLSGYVLSLPVWTGRQPGYLEYLIRRISRIYLPYIAAVAVAAVGCYLFVGSRRPLTEWFYGTWQTPLSLSLMVRQVWMDPSPALNTAFWSLRYEMQMSIIFPLLCGLLLMLGRYSGVVLIVMIRGLELVCAHSSFGGSDFDQTLYYSMFFIVGAALSRERESLTGILARVSTPVLWLMMFCGLALYWSPLVVHRERAGDLFTMLGSCVIILLVQDSRMSLGLERPIPEYLGRISYSVYLVHGTVLFALLNLLYGRVHLPILSLLYFGVVLVFSHFFCVMFEEPSLNLGKRVARRIRDKEAHVLQSR